MKRFSTFILIFGIIAIAAVAMRATAQDGPPGGPGRGGPGGPGGPGGGFHLIPRFAIEKLNLTADQQEQIAELEKEVKAKLGKILTPEQKKILETARPPRPGQGGPDGQGGGRRGQGRGPGGPGGGQSPPPQRPASE